MSASNKTWRSDDDSGSGSNRTMPPRVAAFMLYDSPPMWRSETAAQREEREELGGWAGI
jgi:hypothetical protein